MKNTTIEIYAAEYGRGYRLSDDDSVTYELDFWRDPQKGSAEQLFIKNLCGNPKSNPINYATVVKLILV